MIDVTDNIFIDENDIELRFIRSSGLRAACQQGFNGGPVAI
ncbi:MAG: hypothetical protein R3C26_14215 [Calditrichia bacterium]